ncbi:helix-turn-helix domain-containing protein [Nocardia sp. NPDC004068]|uniref:helix-turn-helix domain-containing protein n=1 Tax=Nocardia sp. NPDC004068 TaxID=3364303 RepID=UPI0036AD0E1C
MTDENESGLSSTFAGRQLGRGLREMREKTRPKMSRDAAAAALEIGANTLWRYESGHIGRLSRRTLTALCELYGAPTEVTDHMLALLKDAKMPNLWQGYRQAVPSDFEAFVGLEQSARFVSTFQSALLPGLLQTPAYRRSLSHTIHPDLPQDVLDRRMALLGERQRRLTEPSERFQLQAILEESVIRRIGIGGAEVQVEQLTHLARLATQRNVNIRVVPQDAAHVGLETGSFTIMDFPSEKVGGIVEPPLVFIEGFTAAQYIADESDVHQYRVAYAAIEKAALSQAKSRALILKIAKEYV